MVFFRFRAFMNARNKLTYKILYSLKKIELIIDFWKMIFSMADCVPPSLTDKLSPLL